MAIAGRCLQASRRRLAAAWLIARLMGRSATFSRRVLSAATRNGAPNTSPALLAGMLTPSTTVELMLGRLPNPRKLVDCCMLGDSRGDGPDESVPANSAAAKKRSLPLTPVLLTFAAAPATRLVPLPLRPPAMVLKPPLLLSLADTELPGLALRLLDAALDSAADADICTCCFAAATFCTADDPNREASAAILAPPDAVRAITGDRVAAEVIATVGGATESK